MIKLFEIGSSDNLPYISTEAKTLIPFKKIVERDKSKGKELAFKELAYIYWSGVFDSQYEFYDEVDRMMKIKRDVGLGDNWNPDNLVLETISFFKDSQKTRSSKYLESSKMAVENLSDYLHNLDLKETDKKGELVHDIAKVRALVKDMPDLVKSMNEIKAMVAEELKTEELANRAGRKTNKYNAG